jgi:hypothetical protein
MEPSPHTTKKYLLRSSREQVHLIEMPSLENKQRIPDVTRTKFALEDVAWNLRKAIC